MRLRARMQTGEGLERSQEETPFCCNTRHVAGTGTCVTNFQMFTKLKICGNVEFDIANWMSDISRSRIYERAYKLRSSK